MKAFFAYASSLPHVRQTIHAAHGALARTTRDPQLHLWEENDISGRPLTDPIFDGIANADVLIADVSSVSPEVGANLPACGSGRYG